MNINFEIIADGNSYAVFATKIEAENYRLYAFPSDAFKCEIIEMSKTVTMDWSEFS